MRNIYYDLEFLEGQQDKRIFGIKTGRKTKPTIDIISIGMVDQDGREYYAISKDFNLKEAWNRWDGEYHEQSGFAKSYGYPPVKKYWIRENVLKPIWRELVIKSEELWFTYSPESVYDKFLKEVNSGEGDCKFTYKSLKKLIDIYGKSNKQIAEEIRVFCRPSREFDIIKPTTISYSEIKNPVLYGYYSSYDHVALCWLFGKMINLPKGMPMYTIDLKQKLDDFANFESDISETSFKESLSNIKEMQDYPKQENEHNSLADARWNKKLHDFLNSIL